MKSPALAASYTIPLLAASLLTSLMWLSPIRGQESADEAAFFQSLSSDPKASAIKLPPLKSVSAIEAMMAKWQKYETESTTKLLQQITSTRKIATEILTKKALVATPGIRDALLKEVQRLQETNAEAPLTTEEANPKNTKRLQSLLGSWGGSWSPSLLPFGRMKGGGDRDWSWVDIDAGALIIRGTKQGETAELLWFEKPGTIKGINTHKDRYTISKKDDFPVPVSDPMITKLQADEIAMRATTQTKLNEQRKRVLAWLFQQAQLLPANEITDLLLKINKLESAADLQAGDLARLAGDWRWDNTEITFQAQGKVTSKSGQAPGRWAWMGVDHQWLAVVLRNGKTAGDIYMVNAPTDPRQTSMEVSRVVGQTFNATRTVR